MYFSNAPSCEYPILQAACGRYGRPSLHFPLQSPRKRADCHSICQPVICVISTIGTTYVRNTVQISILSQRMFRQRHTTHAMRLG